MEISSFPQTVAWALYFLNEVHPSGSPKYEDRARTPNLGEEYWQNRILDQAVRQQNSHELGGKPHRCGAISEPSTHQLTGHPAATHKAGG